MPNCVSCGAELIWQNDFSYEDYGIDDREGIVSIWVCSECSAWHEVYIDCGEPDPVSKNSAN